MEFLLSLILMVATLPADPKRTLAYTGMALLILEIKDRAGYRYAFFISSQAAVLYKPRFQGSCRISASQLVILPMFWNTAKGAGPPGARLRPTQVATWMKS